MVVLHRLLRSSAAVAVAAARRGLCTVESEPDARFPAGLARRAAAEPPLARRGSEDRNVQWVFLGCPGVSKGTYASGLSQLLGVPHIATSDLVREELASSGPLSRQFRVGWLRQYVNCVRKVSLILVGRRLPAVRLRHLRRLPRFLEGLLLRGLRRPLGVPQAGLWEFLKLSAASGVMLCLEN